MGYIILTHLATYVYVCLLIFSTYNIHMYMYMCISARTGQGCILALTFHTRNLREPGDNATSCASLCETLRPITLPCYM